MRDRVWIAAVTTTLLFAGCTTNVTNHREVNVYNPPAYSKPEAVVVYRVRALRVAEEAAMIKTSGAPQPLPTGNCAASVPVDATGTIKGALQIGCSNPALVETMRQAILAEAPYNVAPGQRNTTLRIGVYMSDPEPGVKHG